MKRFLSAFVAVLLLVSCVSTIHAPAANAAVLLTPPRLQFFDNNGDPLAGGLVYTYTAGTTTPKATYTDQGALTPNANPVVLDSAGRASIWVSGSYKIVVKTSAGVTISTDDNVTSFSSGAVSSAVTDSGFVIQNASDLTKQVQFSASSITTGTTSTITIPNGNGTMVTTAPGSSGNVLTSNGSAWVSSAPSSGGWVKIKTVTASSSATIDFVNGASSVVLDSTYKAYAVVISNLVPATDGVMVYFRTSTNAGSSFDAGASDYDWTISGTAVGSTNLDDNDDADAAISLVPDSAGSIQVGNATGEAFNAIVKIYNPANASRTYIGWEASYAMETGGIGVVGGAGSRLAAADTDGIRFLLSSGNITSGTFTLYGLTP